MKRVKLVVLLMLFFAAFGMAQNYDNAGMDYTKALVENTTAAKRITGFKAYLQKYTDANNQFVKLAYYQLALSYYENKNYNEAMQTGEKIVKIGGLGQGEEARLDLMLGNCYAIKDSPQFNKEKALNYINTALRLARELNDKDLLKAGEDLKSKLSGPAPKQLTPEDQFKYSIQEGDYAKAISQYKALPEATKNNTEIQKLYIMALSKTNQIDTALKELQSLYEKDKKGMTAYRIGEIYVQKAAKNKSYLDQAVNYFLESALLFKKSKEYTNETTAMNQAKHTLFNEKYNLKKKIDDYNSSLAKQQSSSKKNADAISKMEREIRQMERNLEKQYPDIEPPAYETKKIDDKKAQLARLKSGVSDTAAKEAEAITNEQKRIEDEFNRLLSETKKRLNL